MENDETPWGSGSERKGETSLGYNFELISTNLPEEQENQAREAFA
jgi:hypothetical protein